MNQPTLGGKLHMQALAQLHRPPNSKQLASARLAARQSLAAIRAIDSEQLNAGAYADLTHVANTLSDAINELARLQAGRV